MKTILLLVGVLFVSASLPACDDKKPAKDESDAGTGDTDTDGDGDTDADTDTDADPPLTFSPWNVPENKTKFPLPVQAGSMRAQSVVLVGLSVNVDQVRLVIWPRTSEGSEVTSVANRDVPPNDGYLKAVVEGLEPGSWYQYAFFVDPGNDDFTERSVIGQFRTALAPGALEPVVVAGTHGTNGSYKPFTALELTAQHDIDIFLQLGDFTYNDGAETLAAFRASWRTNVDDPGYWAILPHAGQYVIIDDHEVMDSDSLPGAPPAVVEAGLQAFYENTPVLEGDSGSYWDSYRWGDTVEFFALDCRYERDPSANQYISIEQMEWLKQALSDSPCHFKVLLNSVPITQWPQPVWIMAYDRWQGFPEQRRELLDHIADNSIEGVWSLSGDFHVASVGLVDTTPPDNAIREVLMGPGGNKGNPAWTLYQTMPETVAPSAQFDFFYGLPTATIITFDPVADEVFVEFFDDVSQQVLFTNTY